MKKYFLILLIATLTLQIQAQSIWQLRLMPQVAFGTKNTVERPNDEGTRVNLDKDFNRQHDALFSPRAELEFNYKRHHAILTLAWLQDKFTGISNEDILYNKVIFDANDEIETIYRFNTYRIGYRYRIVERNRFNFELGATLLIRDAFISFENSRHKTIFDNVGLAPLISYYIEYKAFNQLSFLSYGDLFAVKVGRAEDIFVGAKYQITPMISALAGYRLLEGGSDSDRIYTMAAYHYISLGVGFEF